MSQITKEIRPQTGKQEDFLSSPADIVIYGGAAGGGKSWGLLLDPLRHINIKGFNGLILRRLTTQIRKIGSLWDQAVGLYSQLGADPKESSLKIKFKNSHIQFSHLEYEKNKYDYQGAEICYLAFDELCQFLESQFWYLLSRNRSTCGIRPYVRATCNPDPDSWVKKLIQWWLNENTGYAIPERSGIIRWFVRINDEMVWGMTKQELLNKYKGSSPKSLTFIKSDVYDNKILLEKNPEYLSNLDAMSLVDRERLKNGNWNIRPTAGLVFKRKWFEIVSHVPNRVKTVRCWDRASTVPNKGNKNPDYTAGLKMSIDNDGFYYIENVSRFRESSYNVRLKIKNIADVDSRNTDIRLLQEPGASGKSEVADLTRLLSGFNVGGYRETGDKVTRAMPVSAQAEAGNIKIVKGYWNEDFLNEAENFDGSPNKHDDQIDALSGAFELLQNECKLQMWDDSVDINKLSPLQQFLHK